MFWIGFFSVYFVMILQFAIMFGLGRLFERYKLIFKKIQVAICTWMYTSVSFVLVIIYTGVSILTSNYIFNALLCAIFLVFSWFINEKMYQVISSEYKEVDNTILTIEDKNICNLFALIGVVVSSAILCFENKTMVYGELISVALGIWIGTYIPISEILMGKDLKQVVSFVLKGFKCKKVIVWIVSIMVISIICVLVSNNSVAVKVSYYINELSVGIAVGSITLILILTIVALVKYRRK